MQLNCGSAGTVANGQGADIGWHPHGVDQKSDEYINYGSGVKLEVYPYCIAYQPTQLGYVRTTAYV